MIEETIINTTESKRSKEKQIVMGLASIKFRQPIEINYRKKCAKRKRVRVL